MKVKTLILILVLFFGLFLGGVFSFAVLKALSLFVKVAYRYLNKYMIIFISYYFNLYIIIAEAILTLSDSTSAFIGILIF